MAFTAEARIEIFKLDKGTCQSPFCDGFDTYGHPKQFFPTDEIHWDKPVIVGDWMTQVSHRQKRTYKGEDPNVFNPDGTRRGEVLDTICHAKYEVAKFCSYKQAMLVLTGQTLRTYNWIENNGYEDQDIPLDIEIFTPREIIDINNIRRAKLKDVVLRHSGIMLPQSIFYSIREMV